MKRKSAIRKTKKFPLKFQAKPLRDLGGPVLNDLPSKFENGRPRTEVGGIPLPPDLEQAIGYYARRRTADLVLLLQCPPSVPVDSLFCDEFENAFDPIELKNEHCAEIQYEITEGMRAGFYLALLRYADDLKAIPEAAAIRAALERGRKKGGAANRKKAAPQRTAIRKRFRELRKSGFSPTDARKVLEQETGKSFRQLERDTKGLT